MGKISSEVSKGLGAAIAEAQAKMSGNVNEADTEALLNSGVEAQKKRKRRTKAEIEADKQSEENSLFEALDLPKEEDDDRAEWEKRSAKNFDEFCEWELEKAKLKGLPEPDFDFRSVYEKGEVVFYVRIIEMLGEKDVKKVSLRTIYPRMLVGSEEKACCHCIGYNERDRVFKTLKEANAYCKSINVSSKYSGSENKNNDINGGQDDDGGNETSCGNNKEYQTEEQIREED